ncbi:hypothetical protein KC19_11G029100 [Ceratodon purpureus]|uniref:Uncharacterized protein n=1 Tax=Ceratodon purpureus TaxID=3225 RepID=A0A8T0GAI1_CERPU|nr:hypothetical protein KC19_11G029100 [Ceratodon purpureus]
MFAVSAVNEDFAYLSFVLDFLEHSNQGSFTSLEYGYGEIPLTSGVYIISSLSEKPRDGCKCRLGYVPDARIRSIVVTKRKILTWNIHPICWNIHPICENLRTCCTVQLGFGPSPEGKQH